MACNVCAGISMRSARGVRFGTLVQIRGSLAAVTADAGFKVGDQLEFQLDLDSYDTVIRGHAEVLRADVREGVAARYFLHIQRMPRADKALLVEWYQEQAGPPKGSDPSVTSRPPLRSVESQVTSGLVQDPSWAPPRPAPIRSTFSIASSTPREGTGRAAIRAVLRTALGGTMLPTSRAALQDPEVALHLEGDAPRVEVRYRTEPAWLRDWKAWLEQGLVLVPAPSHALALETTLTLRLIYEGRLDQECTGRVVLQHPDGLGVALDIDPARLHRPELIDADPDLPLPDGGAFDEK